jgi:hypothetical protein
MGNIKYILIGLTCLFAGCASQNNSDGYSPLGGTNLVVKVIAQPKAGWNDPRNDSSYTGLRPGEPQQLETTDYSSLDEIVVWVESLGSSSYIGTAPNTSIDLSGADPSLKVGGWGGIWDLRNKTGRTLEVFLRTEDGKVMNLGNVPGPGTSLAPRVQGYVEVMTNASDQPVGRVFIAPTPYVQLAKANTAITFLAVPPGKAKIHTWHPRLPGSTTEVNLGENRTTNATVTVGVNSLPKVK